MRKHGAFDSPVVGLDGDDTLWHSETHFVTTTDRLVELLGRWVPDTEATRSQLIEVERANLELFGYGVKAFTLSMIETAIQVSDGSVDTATIQQIINWAKELMAHPVELLDGVADTVADLATRHRLLLVTKGDLLHQESKVARSGLAEHFEGIHIVSEKDPDTYARVLASHDVEPADFVMVGNSLRSDVLPVLGLGGRGIHVPFHFTWALEEVEPDSVPDGVARIATLAELPDVLAVPHR